MSPRTTVSRSKKAGTRDTHRSSRIPRSRTTRREDTVTGPTGSTRPTSIILAAAWLLASSTTALPESNAEVKLRFLEAGEGLIMPAAGGWPLTLMLTMNETKLLGIAGATGALPGQGHTGFLVFEDPDGCPSWDIALKSETCTNPPPLPWPRDEKLLEITPGRTALPAPNECTPLEILSYDFVNRTNTSLTRVGPCTGQGYAYGPNPRFPGLIVIADHGPGIVTDGFFNRPLAAAARNLAGLFDSVAYAPKDARAKTSVVAHMNVPRALFSPVVQIDQSPGDWCGSGPGTIVRVDGSAASCDLDPFAVLAREVVVRAFVINGQAPTVLVDGNRDGVIDIRDAETAGLELLSKETRIRFRQLHHVPLLWVVFYDLDGNGEAGVEPWIVSGPAELTNPPR